MLRAAFAVLLLASNAGAWGRSDPIEERFKKANALIEKGRFAEARTELDDALGEMPKEDPRLVRYHERTGAAWLQEGKVKEARASFTAALKATQRLSVKDDSGAKAFTGMGLVLRKEGNDKYALRFFKKALGFKLDEGTRMFAEDQIREIEGEPPQAAK